MLIIDCIIATYSSNSRIHENQNPIYAKTKFYRRVKKLFSDWIIKLYLKHLYFLGHIEYNWLCKYIFNFVILKIKKNIVVMGYWFFWFSKLMYTVFWFSLLMGFWFDFFRKLHQYMVFWLFIIVFVFPKTPVFRQKWERLHIFYVRKWQNLNFSAVLHKNVSLYKMVNILLSSKIVNIYQKIIMKGTFRPKLPFSYLKKV